MDNSQPVDKATPWWGHYKLKAGEGARWKIGPCTLWIVRSELEWRVFHLQRTDPLESGVEVTVPLPEDELQELLEGEIRDVTSARYSFQRTGRELSMQPTLADRPVVTRPESPIFVLPGEVVTLYVSSPVWIRVTLDRGDTLLHEVSSIRPSDTWFGPSTLVGELCYATRTAGRFRLEDVPHRLHRAVTPTRIENQASDALALERVQIPTQYLALYRDSENLLWTQPITLIRREGEAGASVRIEQGKEAPARKLQRIQEPRVVAKKNLVVSTFGAIGSIFGS